MKAIFTALLLTCSVFLYSQSDEEPLSRSGKFFIETGLSFNSLVTGGSSGFGFISEDLSFSVFNLSVEMGKFTTENFAWKGALTILSADGETLFGLRGSVKWYPPPAATILISPGLGFVSIDSEFFISPSLFVGYAFRLADNIHLEPALGLTLIDDLSYLEIKIPFVLDF